MSKKLEMVRSGSLNLFRKPLQSRTVAFNLTNACNFSCEYCIQEQYDLHVSHLPFEFITRMIDICASHGKVTSLNFTGGEPSIHPDFYEILSYARDKGAWKLTVITNGSGGTDYFEKVMSIDSDVCNAVSIHFENYDLKKCCSIIEHLSLFSSRQRINILFMAGKMHEVEKIVGYARKAGNIDVNITAIIDSNNEKTFYKYTFDEIAFAESIVKKNKSENFADFTDGSKIYRVFGYANSFRNDHNIFRYFGGMNCTTCMVHSKIRSSKIYPLLCDTHRVEDKLDPSLLFRFQYLRCNVKFCTCEPHTLHPKFSDIQWAPCFMGGAIELDAFTPQILDIDQIGIDFSGHKPSHYLK